MDKEKYLRYRRNADEFDKIIKDYRKIEYLLNNYASFFKDEKSLEALEKIRQYFYSIGKKLNDLRFDMQMEHFDIVCQHEILFECIYTRWNDKHWICPLCGAVKNITSNKAICVTCNIDDIDYDGEMKILKTINNAVREIVLRDGDIFREFKEEFKTQMEKDDIKVSYTLRRKYVKKRNS